MKTIFVLAAVLGLLYHHQVSAYSKYGRTCVDIGCTGNEVCVMKEDPCPRLSKSRTCGPYPACQRVSSAPATCATYVCPPSQVCQIKNGAPRCVTKVEFRRNRRQTQNYAPSAPPSPVNERDPPAYPGYSNQQTGLYPNLPASGGVYPGYPSQSTPAGVHGPGQQSYGGYRGYPGGYPVQSTTNHYGVNPGGYPVQSTTNHGVNPGHSQYGVPAQSTTNHYGVNPGQSQYGGYPVQSTTNHYGVSPGQSQYGGYPAQSTTNQYGINPGQSQYAGYPVQSTTNRNDGRSTSPQLNRYPSYPTQYNSYPSSNSRYPNQAYPSQQYPSQGYPRQPYPVQGYPGQGYPTQGYQNYPNQGGYQNYPNQGGYSQTNAYNQMSANPNSNQGSGGIWDKIKQKGSQFIKDELDRHVRQTYGNSNYPNNINTYPQTYQPQPGYSPTYHPGQGGQVHPTFPSASSNYHPQPPLTQHQNTSHIYPTLPNVNQLHPQNPQYYPGTHILNTQNQGGVTNYPGLPNQQYPNSGIKQTYPNSNINQYPGSPQYNPQGQGQTGHQTYPGGQHSTYPGAQNPTYPGTQNPTYPGAQNPTYPGAQNPTYPGGQHPTYPGSSSSVNTGSNSGGDFYQQQTQGNRPGTVPQGGNTWPIQPGYQGGNYVKTG